MAPASKIGLTGPAQGSRLPGVVGTGSSSMGAYSGVISATGSRGPRSAAAGGQRVGTSYGSGVINAVGKRR